MGRRPIADVFQLLLIYFVGVSRVARSLLRGSPAGTRSARHVELCPRRVGRRLVGALSSLVQRETKLH